MPVQSQQNNVRATFDRTLLLCYFADFEQLFAYGEEDAMFPVGKDLFKVRKITLEQRSIERCSYVILLTLNSYLPTGKWMQCSQWAKTCSK